MTDTMANDTIIWLISDDEEIWNNGYEFASRDDAVAAGTKEYMGKPFHIAKKGARVGVPQFDASTVIDNLREAIVDEAGSEAADEAFDCTPEQALELVDGLNAVLNAWIEKCDNAPTSYAIDDVESVVP